MRESSSDRRQRIEPSTLDTSRLRPSLLIRDSSSSSGNSTAASSRAQSTVDDQADQWQDDACDPLEQPRASEPDILASVGGSSVRATETLSSSFDNSTDAAAASSSTAIRILAKPLHKQDVATKRENTGRRESEWRQLSSNSTSLQESEPPLPVAAAAAAAGLSRGLGRGSSSKSPNRASASSSRTQVQHHQPPAPQPQLLVVPGDLPLPQPLPEPTPATPSLPGAYANASTTSGTQTTVRRERRVPDHLDAAGDDDGDDDRDRTIVLSEEAALPNPPPLIEATLVVLGSEDIGTSGRETTPQFLDPEIPAVQAEQARLTDLLQNRKLQYFLCGLICCCGFIFITVFAVVLLPLVGEGGEEPEMMITKESSTAGTGSSGAPPVPSPASGSSTNNADNTLNEFFQSIAHGIEEGAIAGDDFWANLKDDDHHQADDDSIIFWAATHQEHFRQYLVFDRQPQWNDTVRASFQDTTAAFVKDAMLEALNYVPPESINFVDTEILKYWVRNSSDVECLILNERTTPLERYRLDDPHGSPNQRLLPSMTLNVTFDRTVSSSDLWETDVLYVIRWNSALGHSSPEFGRVFPRYVEDNMERFIEDHKALWGEEFQSVSPPVVLDVIEDPDEDDDDVVPAATGIGHYRQRFIMTLARNDGVTTNKAIFESIMEIYSLNLLRDVIPNIPGYQNLNVDDIETECQVQVTSSAEFPAGEAPPMSEELVVQFVSYSIWWNPQEWSKPVNISKTRHFPELFLEYINGQLPTLTDNLVGAGLMVLQSRQASVVDPAAADFPPNGL